MAVARFLLALALAAPADATPAPPGAAVPRQLSFPADPEADQALASAPAAVRALTCAQGDRACGRETKPWLDSGRAAGRGSDQPISELLDRCTTRVAEEAAHGAVAAPLGEWKMCVDIGRPVVGSIPTGPFRAPAAGWLLLQADWLSGDHDHGAVVGGVLAVELASGAFYLARRVFRPGDVKGQERLSAGSIPIKTARHLALVTVLAGQARWRKEALQVSVPERIRALGPDRGQPRERFVQWVAGKWERWRWRWTSDVAGSPLAEGPPTQFPETPGAKTIGPLDDQVRELAGAAESELKKGCPPALFPRAAFPLPGGPGAELAEQFADQLAALAAQICVGRARH